MSRLVRSLRGRLQLWNALILSIVILGFGSMLRWEMHQLQWDQIDNELLGSARIIEGSIRGVSHDVIESLAQDLRYPPGPLLPPPMPRDGKKGKSKQRKEPRPNLPAVQEPSHVRPGADAAIDWNELEPATDPNQTDAEWEASLQIPRSLPQPLGRDDGPTYFVVWRADASILDAANTPDAMTAAVDQDDPRFFRERYVIAQRNQFREVYVRGPRMTMICVGRPVFGELGRAGRRDLMLGLAGLSVFAIGLIGSRWLSKEATRPIESMTKTAAAIGPHSLHQRMDLANVDQELSQLGAVLNSMLERLDESFRQQQRFTADASHELRTPLTVFLAATEHALSRDRTAEEYREHLEACQRSAKRMRQLVESLLELTRIDSQMSQSRWTDCDLALIVDEQVHHLMPLADERQISMMLKLNPCTIRGDAIQLGRVVTNLVHNAIDYNHPGGTITIELINQDATAVLTIDDTGLGIDSAKLPNLFQRFFRIDEARSRHSGGTGLGLAICKAIIDAHHGTVHVVSTPGQGSTFTVRLPSNSIT